jgi:hypothetical protein
MPPGGFIIALNASDCGRQPSIGDVPGDAPFE